MPPLFILVIVMKKLLAFILIFLLALCPMFIISSTAAGDFVVEDGVLVSFTGSAVTVKIPDDVYYIADGAFKDNTGITTLVLNNNIKIIGNEAFYGCTSLKSVQGGDSVTNVGAYAFYGTPYLVNNTSDVITLGSVAIGGNATGALVLDESVGSVSSYAFAENKNITSIKASENLSEIGEGAFYRCSSLSEVSVTNNISYVGAFAFYSTKFVTEHKSDFVTVGDGILAEYKGDESSVEIPENVKQIAGGAFYFNSHITDVTLPEGVISIGQRAFMNCTKLGSVNLPESLLMIDKEAFARCKALKEVTVPENVAIMGESVFYGCNSLEEATLNFSGDVSKGLFANCSALEYVKLPENIRSIGDSAFLNCSALTDLVVSDSLTYIGADALKGTDNLTVSCFDNSYTHTYCAENGINTAPCGDANMDGKLNIRDATYIQKHVASVVQMSPVEILRADINFDGKLNVRDATFIQKQLAGIL